MWAAVYGTAIWRLVVSVWGLKVRAAHFGKETKSPRFDVPWGITKVDMFICNKILLKAVCFS